MWVVYQNVEASVNLAEASDLPRVMKVALSFSVGIPRVSTEEVNMGWRELSKELKELGKLRASVGWHETAKYDDGTPVALVATTHEYGSIKQGIPPRPVVRPTIQEKSREWSYHAGQGFKAVADGRMTPLQVMTALGEAAAGDVRMTISEIQSPPLRESTVSRRVREGFHPDKPLVRSGLMLTTCTSEVTK